MHALPDDGGRAAAIDGSDGVRGLLRLDDSGDLSANVVVGDARNEYAETKGAGIQWIDVGIAHAPYRRLRQRRSPDAHPSKAAAEKPHPVEASFAERTPLTSQRCLVDRDIDAEQQFQSAPE